MDLLKEHQFVEYMGDILVDAGEIGDCTRCSFQARGIKVDGYYYDEEFGQLFLIVAIWKDVTDEASAKISKSEIDEAFHRCLRFFKKSKANLFEKIEIANEAHDLAGLIHDEREKIVDATFILITDGITDKQPAIIEVDDGIEIKKIIWDIKRIVDFIDTGERELLRIDFGEANQIPCLFQKSQNDIYTSYLAFIPGDRLADLYSLYGTKMLEMNVRVFLSARGKVNKGIRETIMKDPSMFCAYNNGITVFARELDFVTTGGQSGYLRGVTDFQIVNGGQTVASLYHAKKKQKAVLSNIQVPMKLINIHDENEIENLVPRISEYSNTQNKVSLSDLSANDRPHPEIFELSKRLWAPDPTGGSRTTHWFYEKARGSYDETRRLEARTAGKEREYDALNPKNQKFDKGMFGKVWNTYLRRPYLVSLGAQKNFAFFNIWLEDQEMELESFFRQTVALLILWRDVEQIVRKQGFQGYRHNIVTYTLAWLIELTQSRIDLNRIWSEQKSGDSILIVAEDMCQIVNDHIRKTSQNVTEYCKREECWKTLLDMEYLLPDSIESCYLSKDAVGNGYDPRTKDERDAINFCLEKKPRAWFDLAVWLKMQSFLTPKARSQCFTMGKFLAREREPSYVLSFACKKAWNDAEMRGWDWKENGEEK